MSIKEPPSITDQDELTASTSAEDVSAPAKADDGVEYITVRLPICRKGLPPVRLSDQNLSGRVTKKAGTATVYVKAALLRLLGSDVRVTQKSAINHILEAVTEAINGNAEPE